MHEESRRLDVPAKGTGILYKSQQPQKASGVREGIKEPNKESGRSAPESEAIADVVNKLRPYAANLPQRDTPQRVRPKKAVLPGWVLYFLLGMGLAAGAALVWFKFFGQQ